MIKIKQIGASLSLMIFLWSCSGSNGGNQPQANTVKTYPVVEVQEKSLTGYFEFPANIMGKVNNNVRAKIQGYITKVLVDEGQYVQAGHYLLWKLILLPKLLWLLNLASVRLRRL